MGEICSQNVEVTDSQIPTSNPVSFGEIFVICY